MGRRCWGRLLSRGAGCVPRGTIDPCVRRPYLRRSSAMPWPVTSRVIAPVTPNPQLTEMNNRSREVFRLLVETYLETGEPVGSRTLSRALSQAVSAASRPVVIRTIDCRGARHVASTTRQWPSTNASATA